MVDLIVNNVNMEAFVLEIIEKNKDNHYLKLKLKGDNKNKFGVAL
jgi:hypothetical protein